VSVRKITLKEHANISLLPEPSRLKKGFVPVSSNPEARQNWAGLRPGDRVTVSEFPQDVFEAIVDVLTQDSAVIWVLPEPGFGRRAFDCREGVDIRKAHTS
jgi:hypothetical protein